MGKSLEEIYNKIQLQRNEAKKIEESKINELNLIKERQLKSHLNDLKIYRSYSSGRRAIISGNSYVDDDYIDDYFI